MALTLISDAALDGGPDYVATATKLIICSEAPTTYTEANSTYALADIVVDSSDFSKADQGDGRRVTLQAQSAVDVDVSGSATHWALVITSSTTLVCAGTLSSTVILDDAGTVDIAALIIDVDPTI